MLSTNIYFRKTLSQLLLEKGLRKLPDNSKSLLGSCNISVSNNLKTNLIYSVASNILVNPDVNSGISPTINISSICNNLYGRIQIIIGSSPSGLLLCKIVLANKYNNCICYINSFNSISSNYEFNTSIDNSGINTVINVFTNTTTISGQTLIFNYMIVGI